jgi:hypothetical protein
MEIQAMLKKWSSTPENNRQKFPAIILFEDVTIDRSSVNEIYGRVKLNLAIVNSTKPAYSSMEREVNNFVPILNPIYWEFLEALSRTTAFRSPDKKKIRHQRIDHKFWGRDENTKNVFSDFVDAIEMTNVDLAVDFDNCIIPL